MAEVELQLSQLNPFHIIGYWQIQAVPFEDAVESTSFAHKKQVLLIKIDIVRSQKHEELLMM